MDATQVKHDALCTTWAFIQMGSQQANIPYLIECCGQLQQLMTQKTAGQRKDKSKDINFYELDRICNSIVMEAMCLYLSGELDYLSERRNDLDD